MWTIGNKKYYEEKDVKQIIQEYKKQIKQLKKQLQPKLTEDIQQYRKDYYQKNIKPLKDKKRQEKENKRQVEKIGNEVKANMEKFFNKHKIILQTIN